MSASVEVDHRAISVTNKHFLCIRAWTRMLLELKYSFLRTENSGHLLQAGLRICRSGQLDYDLKADQKSQNNAEDGAASPPAIGSVEKR